MWEYNYSNSDELIHWLYIKRVRKGDKWRYYYKKDKAKLRRVDSARLTFRSGGSDHVHYEIRNRDTNNKLVRVSKAQWERAKNLWWIGDRPAKEVAKEQIKTGFSFVKDFLTRKADLTSDLSKLRKKH